MRIYLVYSNVCAYVAVSFIATYGSQSEHVGLQKVLLFDVRPVKNKKVDPLTEAVYGKLDADDKKEYGTIGHRIDSQNERRRTSQWESEQQAKRRRTMGTFAGRNRAKGKGKGNRKGKGKAKGKGNGDGGWWGSCDTYRSSTGRACGTAGSIGAHPTKPVGF